MFSGIVETTGKVLKTDAAADVVRLFIERPKAFNDLNIGDSIAVNGVCLTIEEFDPEQMRFSLGPETLKITGWTATSVLHRAVNLERSLRLQDRIHGHLVSGHVDGAGRVAAATRNGGTLDLRIGFPAQLKPYLWRKGSVAVNGVSLTVNAVDGETFSVGLIPETLQRTNLGELNNGATVNLEIDTFARGLVHWAESREQEKS